MYHFKDVMYFTRKQNKGDKTRQDAYGHTYLYIHCLKERVKIWSLAVSGPVPFKKILIVPFRYRNV